MKHNKQYSQQKRPVVCPAASCRPLVLAELLFNLAKRTAKKSFIRCEQGDYWLMKCKTYATVRSASRRALRCVSSCCWILLIADQTTIQHHLLRARNKAGHVPQPADFRFALGAFVRMTRRQCAFETATATHGQSQNITHNKTRTSESPEIKCGRQIETTGSLRKRTIFCKSSRAACD